MSCRPLALSAAVAASLHVASAAAQPVYVAPGAIAIGAGAGPVHVISGAPIHGAAACVRPGVGYGVAAYEEPGSGCDYGYEAAAYQELGGYGCEPGPYAAPRFGYGRGP